MKKEMKIVLPFYKIAYAVSFVVILSEMCIRDRTYIKETDAEYRKDYNAKGYSYIVTYEDETQIRYLMYDRDNQEGTKTQYVYYKNIKSTDGSWSMMDAEILDMYQYDYESKEVKDLQKTSW